MWHPPLLTASHSPGFIIARLWANAKAIMKPTNLHHHQHDSGCDWGFFLSLLFSDFIASELMSTIECVTAAGCMVIVERFYENPMAYYSGNQPKISFAFKCLLVGRIISRNELPRNLSSIRLLHFSLVIHPWACTSSASVLVLALDSNDKTHSTQRYYREFIKWRLCRLRSQQCHFFPLAFILASASP